MLQYPIALSGGIFIVLYIWLTIFTWIGPIDLFRVTGAVLFGPYYSTIFVYIAEMIIATILFNLSRKLGREYVQQRFKLKSKDIEDIKKDSGLFMLFTLRINPIVPYRVLDVVYGLTKMPFRSYFLIALIASFPRIFCLQFILAAVGAAVFKNPQALSSYLLGNRQVTLTAGLYLLLVFLLFFIALGMKLARRGKSGN